MRLRTQLTTTFRERRGTYMTCNKSWRVWLAAIKACKDTRRNGRNITVHGRVAMETGTQQEEGQNISHQRHQVGLKGSHHRKAHSNNVWESYKRLWRMLKPASVVSSGAGLLVFFLRPLLCPPRQKKNDQRHVWTDEEIRNISKIPT